MTEQLAHQAHEAHEHAHGEGCGHVALPHADHTDYVHDGHVDECELAGHVVHEAHEHAHGEGCGHVALPHADHIDYVHDGHRHAVHGGHVDEH